MPIVSRFRAANQGVSAGALCLEQANGDLRNADARVTLRSSVNSRVTLGMVMKPCFTMPHDAAVRGRPLERRSRGGYPSAEWLDQDIQRREMLRTLTGRARGHREMVSNFSGLRNRGADTLAVII